MLLNVIDKESFKIGEITPVAGMKTIRGEIRKVNAKSLEIEHPGGWRDRVTEVVSIEYAEAIRWGFASLPQPLHQEELEYSKKLRFLKGEGMRENGQPCPEGDEVAIAGYQFAQAVEQMRNLALKGL